MCIIWWESCSISMKKTKIFCVYFAAQCKRIMKIFPSVLLTTVILVCSLALLAAALFQLETTQEKKQKVEIGLVGSTEGSYLGFGIQALQSFDSSRFAIDFLEIDSEKEAIEALEKGELSAYALIPDGFVDALVRGENMPITYVTSAGAAGIGSMVMNELVETISDLITESENGIYGAQRFLREQGREDIYWEASDRLYLRYLDFVLGRELVYEIELTGVSEGLTVIEYYTCSIMILFLLFWGIAAAPFLIQREFYFFKLLRAKGLSAGWQILAEYGAYVLLMFGSFLLVMILAGTATMRVELVILSPLLWSLGMLPVILLFAAIQLVVFEWIANPVTGALIQFLGALGLGYLSGCFYPITFFPAGVQLLAPFLPTGAAMEYSGKMMMGSAAYGALAVMGLYGVGFLLVAVLLRKRRLTDSR